MAEINLKHQRQKYMTEKVENQIQPNAFALILYD